MAPRNSKQSSARQWKRAKGVEVSLPSGNVALCRRPGMEAFLAEGLLPDSLMGIVQEHIGRGQGLPASKLQNIANDKTQIVEILRAMDKILVRVVIEPKVAFHWVTEEWLSANESNLPLGATIPEEFRDDDLIYTDDVDFDDKKFLFQWAVGGTADLERFRKESERVMDDIRNGDEVSNSA